MKGKLNRDAIILNNDMDHHVKNTAPSPIVTVTARTRQGQERVVAILSNQRMIAAAKQHWLRVNDGREDWLRNPDGTVKFFTRTVRLQPRTSSPY